MATLNGERIEELFWDQGIDFSHRVMDNDVPGIELTVGGSTVYVTETWVENDEWYMDTLDIAILVKDNENTPQPPLTVTDEQTLVKKIMMIAQADYEDKGDDV